MESGGGRAIQMQQESVGSAQQVDFFSTEDLFWSWNYIVVDIPGYF